MRILMVLLVVMLVGMLTSCQGMASYGCSTDSECIEMYGPFDDYDEEER